MLRTKGRCCGAWQGENAAHMPSLAITVRHASYIVQSPFVLFASVLLHPLFIFSNPALLQPFVNFGNSALSPSPQACGDPELVLSLIFSWDSERSEFSLVASFLVLWQPESFSGADNSALLHTPFVFGETKLITVMLPCVGSSTPPLLLTLVDSLPLTVTFTFGVSQLPQALFAQRQSVFLLFESPPAFTIAASPVLTSSQLTFEPSTPLQSPLIMGILKCSFKSRLAPLSLRADGAFNKPFVLISSSSRGFVLLAVCVSLSSSAVRMASTLQHSINQMIIRIF